MGPPCEPFWLDAEGRSCRDPYFGAVSLSLLCPTSAADYTEREGRDAVLTPVVTGILGTESSCRCLCRRGRKLLNGMTALGATSSTMMEGGEPVAVGVCDIGEC